jgi:hypothetical protein
MQRAIEILDLPQGEAFGSPLVLTWRSTHCRPLLHLRNSELTQAFKLSGYWHRLSAVRNPEYHAPESSLLSRKASFYMSKHRTECLGRGKVSSNMYESRVLGSAVAMRCNVASSLGKRLMHQAIAVSKVLASAWTAPPP